MNSSLSFDLVVFLFVVFALISGSPNQAQAQSTSVALVTANELNVREQPNVSAATIGKLNRNTFVVITHSQGDWVRIWWLPRKGAPSKSGWVMSKYLRVVRRSLSGGSEYTTPYGARFTLSIDDSDLRCSEGFDGGFRSCELTVQFSYDSNYNGNNEPSVEVECKASLRTIDSKGWPSSIDESGTDSQIGRTGSGTIDIDFSSLSLLEPIVRAKVSDLECEITDVY